MLKEGTWDLVEIKSSKISCPDRISPLLLVRMTYCGIAIHTLTNHPLSGKDLLTPCSHAYSPCQPTPCSTLLHTPPHRHIVAYAIVLPCHTTSSQMLLHCHITAHAIVLPHHRACCCVATSLCTPLCCHIAVHAIMLSHLHVHYPLLRTKLLP